MKKRFTNRRDFILIRNVLCINLNDLNTKRAKNILHGLKIVQKNSVRHEEGII